MSAEDQTTESTESAARRSLPASPGSATVDALIEDLEFRGLGWSLDHNGRMIEARVWKWPHVIGRYRPDRVEPLADMLAKAMMEVDWRLYPPNDKLTDRGANNQ